MIRPFRSALLCLALLGFADGQVPVVSSPGSSTPGGSSASAIVYYSPSRIPSVLRRQFTSLGSRLQQPGNERITLAGNLIDSSGTSAVQVVIQNGGNLNITLPGASAPLTFNGTTAAGVSSRASQDGLLQSFVDDLPETMILSAAGGMGLRLLGQGFRDSTGGSCDYYDVPSLGQTSKTSTPTLKRYCFDSQTSLLKSVRYQTAGGIVKTEFTWQQVNGQAVPASVTRTQGATQLFSFQTQSAGTSASASGANIFSPSGN